MSSSDEDASQMIKPFRCPSCGAALEVVDAPSVRCKYCGSSVPVPRKYRSQPSQAVRQVTIDLSESYTQAGRAGQRAGCIIALVVLLVVGGIGLAVFTTVQQATEGIGAGFTSIQQPRATSTPALTPTPAFAGVVLEFGGEGSGPGLFDDARYIAVDKDGGIYVADFDDGRVQKFDAEGEFVWQITTPPDEADYNNIAGLTVDFEGSVYVSRRGDILVLSADDGELIDTFPGVFAETWYTTLAVDANNTLYALHESAGRDDLLVLNEDGAPLARWEKFVSSQNRDDPAISLDIAVDGQSNVYVSSSFGDQVYVFDKSGKFVDRFGEAGDEPGAMNNPGAIAIDGRNRVYVVNRAIDVYDARGNYLASIPIDYGKGGIRDLAIDIKGNVYAITLKGLVLKYRPTPRG